MAIHFHLSGDAQAYDGELKRAAQHLDREIARFLEMTSGYASGDPSFDLELRRSGATFRCDVMRLRAILSERVSDPV
ncbi:MAG: hypothetical protein AAGJ29_04830 [Pseudomonadota bacterium]